MPRALYEIRMADFLPGLLEIKAPRAPPGW